MRPLPGRYRAVFFMSFIVAATFADRATWAFSIFARYSIAIPSEQEVTRIDISTYGLRFPLEGKKPVRSVPRPVDAVYDRFERRFTDTPSIVRILELLRAESDGWRIYELTTPSYKTVLTIVGRVEPATTFRLGPGPCSDGKSVFAWSGHKVYDKRISAKSCETLMMALKMPRGFWTGR